MLSDDKISELHDTATQIRALTLRMMHAIGAGHLGGSMSIIDILTLLYFSRMRVDPANPAWPDRDRLVLSKGHAGPALYATLAVRGYFAEADCLTLNKPGTQFPSHCDMRKTTGIDMTAGSLGQGLSAAVGMALAGRLDGRDYKTYCVIGDGEAQEGQIWEALMYGAQQKLTNLVVLLDYNGMQIDGKVNDINSLEPVIDRFTSFRYNAKMVDGHDFNAMDAALADAENQSLPSVIILKTVKGKGASFAEGSVLSHHMPVTEENLNQALATLAKGGKQDHEL